MTDSSGRRVTVLNSSQEFLELIDFLLEDEGPYRVTTMTVRETSVERLAATSPELVMVDVITDDGLADQLVRDALEHPDLRGVPVVITSPQVPQVRDRLADVLNRPNVHHLPKPFTAPALEGLVQRLLPSDA